MIQYTEEHIAPEGWQWAVIMNLAPRGTRTQLCRDRNDANAFMYSLPIWIIDDPDTYGNVMSANVALVPEPFALN